MNRHKILLLAATTTLVLAACGSDDTSSASTGDTSATTVAATDSSSTPEAGADSTAPDADPAAGGAEIDLQKSRFAPTDVEISAGDTVTWTNLDGYDHTVTSKDGSTIEYDSGKFGKDETFEETFDQAGTYDFFCQIHPTMRGTVTVK